MWGSVVKQLDLIRGTGGPVLVSTSVLKIVFTLHCLYLLEET